MCYNEGTFSFTRIKGDGAMSRKKVLTIDEFNTYFEQYKNGDEYALEILLKRNFQLVHHIIGVYFSQVKIEYEDLESIGRYYLYKALKKYDPNKNVKFSTFASIVIYHGLLNEVKRMLRGNPLVYENVLSLYEPSYNDINVLVEETIEDKSSDVILYLERQETYQVLYEVLKEFSSRDQEIIKMHYGIGCLPKTIDEIAKNVSLHRSRIGQITQSELKKKRKSFLEKQEGTRQEKVKTTEKPMFIWKK